MGTASGFLVGTYVPLGVLPDFAQLLMKCTPATYIASLYRQVLMKETLSETFKGQDNLLQEFQEKNGRSAQVARFIDKGKYLPYSVRRYSSSKYSLDYFSEKELVRKK